MRWTKTIWDQHVARVGVFTVTVDRRSDGWSIDVNGVKATKRYDSADAAKADAPRIVRAWLTKALSEVNTEESK